jgi:hypothetical protein
MATLHDDATMTKLRDNEVQFRLTGSNNPPAEPGALRFGPLEAAREVANATSRM